MGYCVSVEVKDVRIRAANRERALRAAKSLSSVWRDMGEEPGDYKTLEETLQVFGWETRTAPKTGDLVFWCYCYDKLGDDDYLFRALAPYLEGGGEVHYRGEDGREWKYKFDKGQMQEVRSHRVWDNE